MLHDAVRPYTRQSIPLADLPCRLKVAVKLPLPVLSWASFTVPLGRFVGVIRITAPLEELSRDVVVHELNDSPTGSS